MVGKGDMVVEPDLEVAIQDSVSVVLPYMETEGGIVIVQEDTRDSSHSVIVEEVEEDIRDNSHSVIVEEVHSATEEVDTEATAAEVNKDLLNLIPVVVGVADMEDKPTFSMYPTVYCGRRNFDRIGGRSYLVKHL